MKRKFLAGVMTMTLMVSSLTFTGCGEGENKVDSTKTHLAVLNYDGGVGSEWLTNAAKRFEEKYADESFEEGKKGVVIDITNDKNDGKNGITTTNYAVWFSEGNMYNDYIASEQVMDITDIVTGSLSDTTGGKETGTIADKLTEEQKNALTAIDGKYYVLPHYEVYTGLVYDIDLFDEYGYYFSTKDGFTNVAEDKTVGPDGVKGTTDDGLPSSYEELYTLMDQMVADGVIPFTWNASTENYVNDMFSGLTTSFAGKDEMMLNFTFDSKQSGTKAQIIDSFNGDKPVVKSVEVSNENGYVMSQIAGKYYAYELLEKIMSSDNYHTKIDKSTSHLDVQEKYILSNLKAGESPIAMMIEGSYWYNEASEALKRSENTYKDKAQNRKFGWMPLPVQYEGSVKEGKGKKNTVMESLNSFAFINAKFKDDAVVSKLAKMFLQFCYTDEELVEFSVTTGLPKGVTYDIPQEKLDTVEDYFQKDVLNTKLTSDVVYPYSNNPIFVNDQSSFMFLMHASVWQSTVDGQNFANYYAANKVGITAEDYFTNSFIDKVTWEDKYSDYIK